MPRIQLPMGERSNQQIHGGTGGGLKEVNDSLNFLRIRHDEPAISYKGSDHKNLSITIERTGYKMQSSTKSRMDDLLSAEVGKHDYDWLLTPPETPLFPLSDAVNIHTTKAATSSKANARSVSTGKASRLSLSQSERESSVKPTRSSSTSRSAVSSSLSSSAYLSNSTRSAILNTSTASVTSKASNPGYRSTSRSRPSTPAKAPVAPPSNPVKPKQPQNSRPCTPAVRPNSRPSTPIHRGTTTASPPAITRSASVSHGPAANQLSNGTSSRPSSPAPRGRAKTATPAPPRQETASTARTGSNSQGVAPVSSSIRKQSSSPIVARGRHQDNSPSARSSGKSKEGKAVAIKEEKAMAEESAGRRPIKHLLVEIKQSMGGLRAASLFLQSIRSTVQRSQSYGSPELPIPGPEEVTHHHHIHGNGA